MNNDAVYYAHSMRIYNTPEEKGNLEFLQDLFPTLKCPNTMLTLGNNMENYTDYVKFCSSLVVVSEYQKYIGRGVYLEVKAALANGISVLVMRKRQLYPVKAVKIVNSDDWKIKHALIVL